MTRHVLIVGGGAAGLLAAIAASEHGSRATLLERNAKFGIKILMSGGGRCNITNTGDVRHLVQSFPGNGRFLFSAFSAFTNDDVIEMLRQEGVETKVENRGRVFPVTDSARDVVEALVRRARRSGAELVANALAETVEKVEDGFSVRLADGRVLRGDALIITTGGVSYPTSGTTGIGYRWAEQFGHTIITPRPSIIALETVEDWPSRVRGVALRGVTAVLRQGGRIIDSALEDVLFTHFGISGPAILNISHRAVMALEEASDVRVGIQLREGKSAEQWDAELLMRFRDAPRQQIKTVLAQWLPASLAPVLLEAHGIDPAREVSHLTRTERQTVAGLLAEIPLTVKQSRPIKEAMVTAGGVSVKEIDPKTMESRLVPGLYFAGEVLDVDGISGGYNLQGAYSTGWLAGTSAARAREGA